MKPNQHPKVEFTERQLQYLERMFPEMVSDANTTHAEFLVQSGKRVVVKHLRNLMQKEQP